MLGIKSENKYKGGTGQWMGYEIYREVGMSQFYPQYEVECGKFH